MLLSLYTDTFQLQGSRNKFQKLYKTKVFISSLHYLCDKYFKGKRHIVWVSATILFFLNWFLVAWFVYGNYGVYPKELEDEIFERFDKNISQIAFTLVSYAVGFTA